MSGTSPAAAVDGNTPPEASRSDLDLRAGRVAAAGSVRVVLVDEQALFRRGMEAALASDDRIGLVGEAGTAEEAVAVVEATRPDVVVMELHLPGLAGAEAIRRIRRVAPDSRVLVLTVSDDEHDLAEAIAAGATGYLLKDLAVDDVAEAIHAVVLGQSVIAPTMTSKLLRQYSELSRRAAEREVYVSVLTPRELEVLRLVARGMTNREVAEGLFIAENTVKNHVRNILEKLDLHSRLEAVMYAVRHRLLDPDHIDG